jgi:hypothetical protein
MFVLLYVLVLIPNNFFKFFLSFLYMVVYTLKRCSLLIYGTMIQFPVYGLYIIIPIVPTSAAVIHTYAGTPYTFLETYIANSTTQNNICESGIV